MRAHVHDEQRYLRETDVRASGARSAHVELKEEWNDLKSGRTWDEVKAAVRSGWERAKGIVRRD